MLVRHGRTEWNATQRFQGRTDVPLSKDGQGQARAVARALADDRFDAIYSSDLQRARHTALAIAKGRDLDVRLDVRLREFDFGAWEGLTWAEIVRRFPQLRNITRTSARDYAPLGGETFANVRQRARSFLHDVRGAPHSRVAVVTHAGVLHASIAELFGDDAELAGVRFSPGSITRIAFDEQGPRLDSLDVVPQA